MFIKLEILSNEYRGTFTTLRALVETHNFVKMNALFLSFTVGPEVLKDILF